MLSKIYIAVCMSVFLAFGAVAQQVSPRIAGLEDNEEYMSLLREDAHLQQREDSIVNSVNTIRQQFRDNPDNRQQYTKDILALEEQIFKIRNAKGRLIDRISTIEQEWVISNLDMPHPTPTQTESNKLPQIPENEKVRNLIYNNYFKRELLTADYAALQQAQQQEMQAVDYINRYWANYQNLAQLADRYSAATTEFDANKLLGKYKTLQGLNAVLSDSLAATWNYIFDNKSYAYNYLLDKLGQDNLLMQEEKSLFNASQKLSEIRGQYASDAVCDYFLRKLVAVNHEIQVANLLQLEEARDSLRGVMAQLKEVDYQLPKITVAERYFLDFAPIEFSSAKYNAENPIPPCRVYPHGTIYRILIGSFNAKRSASAFRGAYPLGYIVDDQGKWCYYAGGFATESAAKEALQELKSRGFSRPEIVMWHDGQLHNLTHVSGQTITYKIEIHSTASLPDGIKILLTTSAATHELARVGEELFVIGAFETRDEADKMAAAIRATDGSLEIKVSESIENVN
ncbi:MAG: SPOR domain-containing protein [Alistipes sp.]